MDVSEDESVGSYKFEPPKGPSIASSSRQKSTPISLTPDECNGKNMEDLLNTFLGMGENEVDSNSNLDEGLNFSYGGDQIIFEQADEFNGNDQIVAPARENDENPNSEGSEAAPAAGNGRRRGPTFEEIATLLAKRKRRMIKNRESAQRSRARKLAYIAGLEAQVDRLRENNEMLKLIVTQILTTSQEEEVEKNKETTKAQCVANKLKKLRRVSSVTW